MNLGCVLPTVDARLIISLALGLIFFNFISVSGLVYGQDFESELTGPMMNSEEDDIELTGPMMNSEEDDIELTGPMMNSEEDDIELQTPPETSSEFQSTNPSKMFVKITSHESAEKVDSGTLEILGISSDNNSRDCIVQMDWNNEKPAWIVTPTGPGGESDFSTWSFTYDINTHEIEPGKNELTSKLTCINPGPLNKWYSITLIGNPIPLPRPLPVP
ncbi:MAG: hypothetical protein MRJ93_03965 [Nitrososphaeraceae archaeon]|nr:hypothetical protein [Nitrososphaeraceae archaeon]